MIAQHLAFSTEAVALACNFTEEQSIEWCESTFPKPGELSDTIIFVCWDRQLQRVAACFVCYDILLHLRYQFSYLTGEQSAYDADPNIETNIKVSSRAADFSIAAFLTHLMTYWIHKQGLAVEGADWTQVLPSLGTIKASGDQLSSYLDESKQFAPLQRGKFVYLGLLTVHPEWQGHRLSLRMTEFTIKSLKELGFESGCACLSSPRTQSSFLKHLGFAEVLRTPWNEIFWRGNPVWSEIVDPKDMVLVERRF